ncbi:MAG: cysteine--tRNA ligase [Ferrimicrobium sp.]|jgi:cysteinyl-tRNA synthetase|uniref:Cysteine--tRNA ligase n=1 Tax=Ferrimicrobium acidiphilum TaxID=121039 RepID=A0ABV3Y4M8_9ACTN|nr:MULTISPECIES: cysteine--tRNA ligase [Ferrimicrobium]
MTTLYDTMTGSVTQLINPGQEAFSLYVCGPTVQDRPHLGHGRIMATYDLLRRHLRNKGLAVNLVMNVTDVDDKIISRAQAEATTYQAIAHHYEAIWWETMDRLGIERPDATPHATEWVQGMIEFIQELLDVGAAYVIDDGVYLRIASVPHYGLLTKQDFDQLQPGNRVEVNPLKESPLDFAIWKRTDSTEPGFDAPWGFGRPGWHTECVTMSIALLGRSFDLHGGGMDLIFPHHENELAQAQVLGVPFARHWAHVGFVEMNGEKMSKSIGNTLDLTDAITQFGGRAVRLAYLRAYYRSPLELSPAVLNDTLASLDRIDNFLDRGESGDVNTDTLATFIESLDNDLDTPTAFSILFEQVREGNIDFDRQHLKEGGDKIATVHAMLSWIGLAPSDDALVIPGEISDAVKAREQAKRDRDYTKADQLRMLIEASGFVVSDTKDGTQLRRDRRNSPRASMNSDD